MKTRFRAIIEMTVALILFAGVLNTPAVVSAGSWITVRSPWVEMSIENKTTVLGEEISILMVAPMGGFFPDAQVFDVYLYDSNYSLFSFWSQDKVFAQVLTDVPPGYNRTLRWNLFRYDPATGKRTPPPPGNYYLVGVVLSGRVTPGLPLRIDNFTITPALAAGIGDVNGDGIVDIGDVKKVKLAFSGVIEEPFADLNGDGIVDIGDVKKVKLAFSGIL